ncbi:hypothetical protein D9M68_955390 [compost metagenome]
MAALAIDAQAHLQRRLPGAAQLVERDDPGPEWRGAIHGLLREQIETPDLPAGIARTDIVANRITEQATVRLWLIQQGPGDHGHQFDFVIQLGRQRRVLDVVQRAEQGRICFQVRQGMRRRSATQTL